MCQIFVAGQLVRRHALGAVNNGAGAQRKTIPAPLGITQMGRHTGGKNCGRHGLQHSALGGLPQIAGIDRDEHVRRRIGALGLQPGEQRPAAVSDVTDRDSGLLGVEIEERLDELLGATGIDDDFIGAEGGNGKNQSGHQAQTSAIYLAHRGSLSVLLCRPFTRHERRPRYQAAERFSEMASPSTRCAQSRQLPQQVPTFN